MSSAMSTITVRPQKSSTNQLADLLRRVLIFGRLQGFDCVDRGDHGWGHFWTGVSSDDVGIRPQMGTVRMSKDRVPSTNIESLYGGGVSSLPGATGSLLPVKFPAVPVLLAEGPQLGSWQVAVVRVDETPAGDASGREFPRAEQNRQRPIDVSELHGGPGLPCIGEMLTFPEVTVNVRPDVTFKVLEPLEHAVLIHAGPAGQHAAVGMLSPSDCCPAGPAGPYVAGGPVGPDVSFRVLEPLQHSVLYHADPAGQSTYGGDYQTRTFGSSGVSGAVGS